MCRRIPSQGTHVTPASVKTILSSGKRTGTPVSSMLIALATTANVCEITCAENIVSNACTLNGKTGLMAVRRSIVGNAAPARG